MLSDAPTACILVADPVEADHLDPPGKPGGAGFDCRGRYGFPTPGLTTVGRTPFAAPAAIRLLGTKIIYN